MAAPKQGRGVIVAGTGGNPFRRPAFPVGGYRPADVADAGALQVYGEPMPRVGSMQHEQQHAPPSRASGPWRPTEAELQRWGGRVVLYGAGVPGNASSGTELVQLLDATMPLPQAFNVQIVAQSLSGAIVTPLDFELRMGIGRAGWTQVLGLQPAPSGFASQNVQVSLRQIAVLVRFRAAPAAGEVIACSCGLGLVGT